jgi:hypothetical protein
MMWGGCSLRHTWSDVVLFCLQACLIFLFENWIIDSKTKMTGATFACFALGLCNALMLFLKTYWQQNYGKKFFAKFSGGNHDVDALGDDIVVMILFCMHFSLSYLLMLLAMSYYAGFFFAVVAGKNMRGFALISVCENLLLNLCGIIAFILLLLLACFIQVFLRWNFVPCVSSC